MNRHQLSSKLAYSHSTPAFLQKFKNRMAGIPDDNDDENEDKDEDENREWEDDGSGRPPIPRRPRPAIPERPDGDPGSADEDDDDEKPQVVVLKQGKHLTEREAENIRRKEKGLPPLPDPTNSKPMAPDAPSTTSGSTKAQPKGQGSIANPGLSFSSTKAGAKPSAAKRKTMELGDKGEPNKKKKKTSKTLLSFGDDT